MAMAEKWSAKKAQALQEVEERFSQETARILEGYDLPEHIRLDLHQRHCDEYKVPDDLRLKFMNPAFDGNLVLLEEGEIEALAREESDKFWIEMIAHKRAEEKAQALRDIEERLNESILCSLDKQGIPQHFLEYYRHELKVPDDIHLNFVNDVEAYFGILDHEDELRIKAWEELQRFRIETMDDKPAAKKLQALQHLEERFKRGIAKWLDREDIPSEDIRLFLQEYYQKVPAHGRLKYIIHVEENWGILDHDRDLELRTWEESQQLQIKMVGDKLAAKKVQALKKLEDGYRQEMIDALDEYDFSDNFKLELQEYYRQEYNIPDDFRLQFIHQIEGKFRMLDHREELKVQIKEERDGYCQKDYKKFKMPLTKRSLVTVDMAMAEKWSAKKAQALQEVEERFSQDTARILEGYDLPEHIRLDLHHRHCVEYKVPDDLRLKFMNPAFDGNLVLLEEGEIEALAREESDKFWIEMIARKRAAEKAQALRDIEERFNESILCSLDKKGIPQHIQEYYRHELKVPDDIHLNFVNDVEADFGILDHEDELRIKAWEELQRFRIETMDDKPAAKKLQALRHLEERFKRVIAKRLDRVDIHSENIRLFFQEYYQKVPDHRRLKYIIHLEDNWGILDHDRDLELRTWEESQQFQIKMMDDKLAVKKVQALKNMEDGYRQEIVDALDEYNFSENFKLELQEYYRQEYNVPDDFRLQFIHQIEGKFRMLDHQEELKVQIREEPDGYCQKFKMPRTKRSLVTVVFYLNAASLESGLGAILSSPFYCKGIFVLTF
uniref:Uncharacterized protein n=1 Tax=Oryza punctata TaxID=4537 RepID=A0A0E0M489_ORYPU